MWRERIEAGSGKRNELIQPFIETNDFFMEQNSARKKATFHSMSAALPMVSPQSSRAAWHTVLQTVLTFSDSFPVGGHLGCLQIFTVTIV